MNFTLGAQLRSGWPQAAAGRGPRHPRRRRPAAWTCPTGGSSISSPEDSLAGNAVQGRGDARKAGLAQEPLRASEEAAQPHPSQENRGERLPLYRATGCPPPASGRASNSRRAGEPGTEGPWAPAENKGTASEGSLRSAEGGASQHRPSLPPRPPNLTRTPG